MKKATSVSVLMPVLNEEHYLESAVTSVLSLNFEGELLLILGPSVDGTNLLAEKLARESPKIRLIQNPRGLTTVGLNLSIKQAKFDFVVRVDAHSEPEGDYIQRGLSILEDTGADVVGGIMRARGKTPLQRAVAWAYNSRFGLGGANFHIGGKAGEAESAYLGIFRKSALERVNGYDESIIRGEDWDLAQRIKASGGLVWFSPELTVTYWPRSSWLSLAKQFYSTGVWRGDLTRRDLGRASRRYFIPPLLVLSIFLGIVAGLAGNPIGYFPVVAYLLTLVLLGIKAKHLHVPLALLTMHFCWGSGFIIGFIRGAKGKLDRSRVTR